MTMTNDTVCVTILSILGLIKNIFITVPNTSVDFIAMIVITLLQCIDFFHFRHKSTITY